MHEIPPMAEQLLRAQGVTDAELDELRQTGVLRRGDGNGSTIDVRVQPGGGVDQSTLMIDGTPISAVEVPPAVLEKLRRYHRFLPKQVLQNMELATGQDIDGDGRIAAGSTAAPSPSSTPTPAGGTDAWGGGVPASAHDHVEDATHGYRPSGAMPTTSGSGPFVDAGSGPRLMPSLLLVLVLAGLGYAAYRAFA